MALGVPTISRVLTWHPISDWRHISLINTTFSPATVLTVSLTFFTSENEKVSILEIEIFRD